MKKVLAIALALCMIFALCACAKEQPAATPAATAAAPAESPAEAPAAAEAPKADFSQNVNVARASDYAKESLERPVTGIGRAISTDVKANKEYTIVCMTKNSTNPYMVGMWDGAKQAGEDMNINVVVAAPAVDDSIEEQVSIMETYIAQGVDGFVISPSDSNGIQPAVDLANEAGIPVVAIGTASNTGCFLRSGVDYYETGYATMKALCEQAGGEGGVIILEGPAGAQNAQERQQGALDALEEFPNMKLLASQSANFKRAEAINVMENLLQGAGVKDNLNVIYAANDEMALGAIQVLKASGVSGVLVGGADGNKDASTAIQNGDMAMTYNTDPFGSTYLGFVYIVQYLNDGTLPEEYFIPFPASRDDPFITAENIDTYISSFAWFDNSK
ncbi:MAG: sugar ABC transporter substrate-binding protein [Faecousia sp.]